jgi:actin-related protein
VVATSVPERAFAPWLGGAIVAALPSFDECVVTAADWAEQGPRALHRKCA